MQLTKDKSFFKNFFSLYSMIVLQNVIVLGVNLADNIMLGCYDQISFSGVSAVNQIQFVFQQITMGLSDALVVNASQYWGQKRISPVKSLASGALILGGCVGIALFLAATFFPRQLVGIFTPTEAFIDEGVKYLSIIKFTYLIFAITNLLLALLRSVETVRVSFYISIVTFILNCSINFLLIDGKFIFPEMGVRGAAIGTLVARIVELIIVICYITFADKKLKLKISQLFHPEKPYFTDYFKRCGYFVTVAAMFGVSTALQTVILGHLSDQAIAANSAANALFQVLKVASIGAASATAVIIGKTIGKGEMQKLKGYVNTLQLMFLSIGLLTSALLFVLRFPILSCYKLDAATKLMAEQFILVLCVTCIGTSYQMPVNIGIIRGGGDSKFVFINDLISIWGIVLPVSAMAAFVWELEPFIIVLLLNADQIFKCGAAFIRCNSYKWIKKLTR